MNTSTALWPLALSDGLYRLLVLAYPAAFRRRYGAEMRQVFRDCCREAYAQCGLPGLAQLWGWAVIDVLATAPREHWTAGRRHMMNASSHEHAFGERLAQVLGRDPSYYQLLVAAEPTRRIQEVVDSLALDGDPEQPQVALTLFHELSDGVSEAQAERWLAGLRDAAQRLYHPASRAEAGSLSDTLLRLIYADPTLYDLVAAVEPGYGLIELVESLALEGDVEDVEAMLRLMREAS